MSTVSRQRVPGGAVLVDDQSSPDARSVLGVLVARAHHVDLAIDGIRLAAIDFRRQDLASLQRCRVVLGGFDNHALAGAVDTASRVAAHAVNLGVLREFIASARLEIRSAGARRWCPDFCLARGPALTSWFEGGAVALVGHLGLGANHPYMGPRLTCVLAGARSVALVSRNFQRLWDGGHDILDVVADSLERFAPATT